jgi:hypothetical protein
MMHHLKLGPQISIAGLKMSFQYDTAVLALLAIPFGGIAAAWANPSLLLFASPGRYANITLTANVLKHFTVVCELVIFEIDDLLTWKTGTRSTVS